MDLEDLAVATIEGVVWAELPEAFRKELTRVGGPAKSRFSWGLSQISTI